MTATYDEQAIRNARVSGIDLTGFGGDRAVLPRHPLRWMRFAKAQRTAFAVQADAAFALGSRALLDRLNALTAALEAKARTVRAGGGTLTRNIDPSSDLPVVRVDGSGRDYALASVGGNIADGAELVVLVARFT